MILHRMEEEEVTWRAILWVATCSRTRPVSFFTKNSLTESAVCDVACHGDGSTRQERFWLHMLNPLYPDVPKLWENASGWQSDEVRQTYRALSLCSQGKKSTLPCLWFWHPRFLGEGEFPDFYCMLCSFVVGSSWKPELSSPVVVLFSYSPFSSIHCKISLQIYLLRCSWSLVMFLGTVFARTFFFPKFAVKINRTVSVIHITVITLSKFSSYFDIVGRSSRLSRSASYPFLR
jgi:hypothetical protein